MPNPVIIAHETWTGTETIETSASIVDIEISVLADHWESQGEDAAMLRTARETAPGVWTLDDGTTIARAKGMA